MTEEQEEYIEGEVKTLTVRQDADIDYVPSFAITLEEAQRRLHDFKQFIAEQMVEGEDYGKIPGTTKPTLLKPGAEKLCNIYSLAPHFEELRSVEDWERPLFYYVYRCVLTNKRTGIVEADCIGSCNSWEDRYRYRWAERVCPSCGKSTVIKGKEEYGGGWICYRKQGGCGAKFSDGDGAIENQEVGKVENKDIFSLVNTIQKMSQKRALVGATLIATRASDSFTQDVEDLPSESLATPAVSGEEGNFITVGGKKYPADGKISQGWFDRLQQRIKEAGMVGPHLTNHLKKHYSVSRINDLTYAQALAFGKHLAEMIEQKDSEPAETTDESVETTEEEINLYAIPPNILKAAEELDIEGFDFGVFMTTRISPDTPMDEPVQALLLKLIQGLKQGGDPQALGDAFEKQLAKLRSDES